MSTYIGARYVPKFMGTYDATQAYENMVVVDNGLGTSYISTKPTPAGTPLTDTDYWAIYGASSGAIINLQNQIDDLTAIVKAGFVVPQMYGAAGDGVTDDTTAFIDTFNNNNCNIFIPAGTYRLTDNIPVNDNTKVICAGAIIDGRNADQPNMVGLFDLNNVDSVILDGLHITGSGALNTAYNGGVIVARNDCTNIIIRNCTILNTPFLYAIATYDHGDHVLVDNCYVKEFSYGGICNVDGCDNFTVSNCKVYNPHGTNYSNTYPISLGLYDNDYVLPVRISTNLIADSNYVECSFEKWEAIETHYGKNITITNNVSVGSRSGIAIAGGAVRDGITLTAEHVIISNNTVIGPGTTGTINNDNNCGIILSKTSDAVVSNNIIDKFAALRNNSRASIVLISECDNVKFNNNVVHGGDITNAGSYFNGVLVAYCTNIILNSNEFSNGNVYHAISFEDSNECYFTDNIIDSFDSVGIIRANNYAQAHYIRSNNNYTKNHDGTGLQYIVPEFIGSALISSVAGGKKGDIIKNIAPATGSPIGWICTSPQIDALTPATWVALPNL